MVIWQNNPAKEKRSRSEGIPGISASNTLGTGNIWFGAGTKMFMQTIGVQKDLSNFSGNDSNSSVEKDFIVVPHINGTIGLTGFVQIEINSIPYDGKKIGLTMASLKLTIPGKDNLRYFGLAGKLNVALATEENVFTTLEETPAFDPILTFTGIADVDFIKKHPSLPLKLYFNYSNHDNFKLHNIYQQHHAGIALEYKDNNGSLYLRTGAAFYKEKKTIPNPSPDPDFRSPLFDMGLGIKKRFKEGIPFVLSADINFDPVSPLGFLDSELHKPFQIDLTIKIPVFYKETNTEALRSLIYSEQLRLKNKNKINIGKLKPGSASTLTLNRLLLENYERDLLDDEVLNKVFKKESKKDRIKRHIRIKKEIDKNQESSE